jgi:hypothetical protein
MMFILHLFALPGRAEAMHVGDDRVRRHVRQRLWFLRGCRRRCRRC